MTYKILIDHRACSGGGCEDCKGKGTARVKPLAPPDLSISADDFEEARQGCPCYEGIKVNAEVSQCSHPKARQFDSWCSLHDCPALTPNA